MQFDFSRPIGKNRDEVLLVKFQGCIKNVGEMMFKAAQARPNFNEYWLSRYTKFSMLLGKSDEEVFNLLAPFNSAEFLKYMATSIQSYNKLEAQTTIQDFAKLMSLMNPYTASTTNMEIVFRQLLGNAFCKHLYIYDTAFSEVTKRYLSELFARNLQKVSILEGKLYEILDEKPEITTIFSDSVGEVCETIQAEKEGSDKYDQKSFMISALPNIYLDDDKKVHYENEKFLSETKERFKCETNWFQLKFVSQFDFEGPEIKLKGELQ